MQNARWSTAVAAAALLAMPVAARAQTAPPQNPPVQQSQPPSQPPAQPPAQPPTEPAQPPAAAQPAQPDVTAARAHLMKARDTLSAVTSMPEAAKLQGDARTKVSQLISDFNTLISTQSEWRSAYVKVDADLTAILGAEPPPDQPVGTSGSAAVDPAIRARLAEFRTHLKAFESAAGGPTAGAGGTNAGAAPAPTPAASSPATPASPANPANPAAAGVSPSAPAEKAVDASARADAQKELDAIAGILEQSKTGALTRAQTTELRRHVEVLRVLLSQR